jgi:hypothetical protein
VCFTVVAGSEDFACNERFVETCGHVANKSEEVAILQLQAHKTSKYCQISNTGSFPHHSAKRLSASLSTGTRYRYPLSRKPPVKTHTVRKLPLWSVVTIKVSLSEKFVPVSPKVRRRCWPWHLRPQHQASSER